MTSVELIVQEKPLRAYVYRDDHEGYCTIYFTKTVGQAKYKAANDNGEDFINVRVERVQEFDKYADKGYVPIADLLEYGWWYECHECSRLVSKDHLEEGARLFDNHVLCAKCAAEIDRLQESND
jgi:hypothetical protein